MNTNMTGFRWFSKILAFLYDLDESSLSIGKVRVCQLLYTVFILLQFNQCVLCAVHTGVHTIIWISDSYASPVQHADMIVCHSTPVHKN